MSIAAVYRRAFFDEYEAKCRTLNGEVAYNLAKTRAAIAAADAIAVPAYTIGSIADAARVDFNHSGILGYDAGCAITRASSPIMYFSRGTVDKLIIRDLEGISTEKVVYNVSAFETIESVLRRTGMLAQCPYGISVEKTASQDDDDDDDDDDEPCLHEVYISTDEMRVGHCIHTAVHDISSLAGAFVHLQNTPNGDAQHLTELTIVVGYDDDDYYSTDYDDSDSDSCPPSPGEKRSSSSASPSGKKSRPSDE